MMFTAEPQPAAQKGVQPPAAAPMTQPQDHAGSPVDVEVSYSGAVDALPETAKIYVFVRPVGERMPLGAQTFGVHELPLAVAFTPNAGAAEAKPVEVVARLSMSGQVSLQPGDLETVSGPLQFGAAAQRVQLKLGAMADKNAPASVHDAAVTAVHIGARVSLGEAVHLPATTTVFLIVRSSNGPPMPLAVKRFTVSDLPIEVTLSDADAMMPGAWMGDRQHRSHRAHIRVGQRQGRTGRLRSTFRCTADCRIDRPSRAGDHQAPLIDAFTPRPPWCNFGLQTA